MRHTIRFRLTLWSVAALALSSLVLGGASLALSQRSLFHWLDESLAEKARLIARCEIIYRPSQDGEDGYMVASPEGQIVEIRGLPQELDLTRTSAFVAAVGGESASSTVQGSGRKWRVVSWPRGSGPPWAGPGAAGAPVEAIVLVAHDLHEVDSMLAQLRWVMLALLPLALAWAGVGGYLLVGRALSPVDSLAARLEAISEHDLGQRHPDLGQDEMGRLARVVNSLLDRLQQAFERQRRFTADASHELRTPLATVRALTSQKLMRSRTVEEYRETLQRIGNTAEYMSDLVRQLLLLARADGGNLLPEREVFDLGLLLSQVADQTREAHARDVRCEATPVEVEADPTQMIQLFLNLLENAARHTPPDGTIEIRLERRNQCLVVIVQDNGEGIPAEHLPHIFERFYRADPARSRDTGGTGLGLPIARCIAELHGGSLELDSLAGQGTTVRVYLKARS